MQSAGSQGARCLLFLAVILLCAVGNPANVRAQLVADGSTNVLDSISTNIIGDVTIGTNGSFTLLALTNGAAVTNSGSVTIGYISDAHSNAVVVNAGCVWKSGATIIGQNGSFNRLSILDGGFVMDNSGFIGMSAKGASNLALISGIGSLWTNAGDTYVGQNGSGNQLVVTNGGTTASGRAYIGSFGSSNRATITGTGSVWTCSSLAVGGTAVAALNNRLIINNGGSVSNSGACTIGSYSLTNSVLVTDPGTTFWNGSYILLGYLSHGNLMVVSNGAVVTAAYTYIEDNGGTKDKLIVTGAGSLLTNETEFHVGHVGSSNFLFVTQGGTLADNVGYIGSSSLAGNQALITDPNSVWTNRSDFYVGYAGPRNQLIVSNGAGVFDGTGYIGYNTGANSNTVVITGSGSLWTNRSALHIGNSGSYNQLVISNGGTVVGGYGYVGSGSAISSNRIIVSGPGSLWKTLINVTLGMNLSGGNQLIVSNGATVQAQGLTIGSTTVSVPGNTVTVDGGNIIVTNSFAGSTFLIGYYGTLNLNSGLIRADTLTLDAGNNTFNFRGGTLQTHGTGSLLAPFIVGDGSALAVYELLEGSHRFGPGAIISSNATLKGTGTIYGNVAVASGATMSPGSSIGKITIYGDVVFAEGSTNVLEVNAGTGTCDTLARMTNLTYGGTLLVSNVGGALVNGSSFRLFSASNYSGAFSAIIPTSPGPGLKWNTNELNVDGVLRVFALQSPPPSIAGVQVSGANIQIQASGGIPYDPCFLLSTTNIASPAGWEIWSTNAFDSTGEAIFNPAISLGETARFFKLMVD